MRDIVFRHTNIVCKHWRSLAAFYQEVFDCRPAGPIRSFSGVVVSEGTGTPNAVIRGIHLRLPGVGRKGPTLEIFEYDEVIQTENKKPNREGYAHIAFETGNVSKLCAKVIEAGGAFAGKIVKQNVEGVGVVEFAYVRDPEGNLIEIQSWSQAPKDTFFIEQPPFL